MNKDRYPELGPKYRVATIEACLEMVRKRFPAAYMEGSTGAERTFFVERRLVAHAWPISRQRDAMWLRVGVGD